MSEAFYIVLLPRDAAQIIVVGNSAVAAAGVRAAADRPLNMANCRYSGSRRRACVAAVSYCAGYGVGWPNLASVHSSCVLLILISVSTNYTATGTYNQPAGLLSTHVESIKTEFTWNSFCFSTWAAWSTAVSLSTLFQHWLMQVASRCAHTICCASL